MVEDLISESAFENKAVALLSDLGYYVRKMEFVARKGCPDRFCAGHGISCWLEFKRGKRGSLSHAQEGEIADMRAHGVDVRVVRYFDDLRFLVPVDKHKDWDKNIEIFTQKVNAHIASKGRR